MPAPLSGLDLLNAIKTGAIAAIPVSNLSSAGVAKAAPLPVPDSAFSMLVAVDRSTFSKVSHTLIFCMAEISMDAGASWRQFAHLTANGETPAGFPDLCQAIINVPIPPGTARQVRILIASMNDVQTKVDIKWL